MSAVWGNGFVDFPPTVLSLLALEIPTHMQGTAFLGQADGEPRQQQPGAPPTAGVRGEVEGNEGEAAAGVPGGEITARGIRKDWWQNGLKCIKIPPVSNNTLFMKIQSPGTGPRKSIEHRR